MSGVNDNLEEAKALTALIKGMHGHVNLIPVNPIKERDYRQSDRKAIEAFQAYLEKNGINVTVRREMGRDINGACGQLRKSFLEEEGKGESDHGGMCTDRHRTEAEHESGFYLCQHKIPSDPWKTCLLWRMAWADIRRGFRFPFVVENLVRFFETPYPGPGCSWILKEGIRKVNRDFTSRPARIRTERTGSTLVLATIRETYFMWQYRRQPSLSAAGALEQITKDHSYVEELVAMGKLKRAAGIIWKRKISLPER